jgi:heme exporter protein A
MTAKAVVAAGVERRFGRVPVLRSLDLTIDRGSSTVLFGENGAGKTTLLRTIAGLCRPNRGTVEVLGTRLPGGPDLRRRIGVLGHQSSLYGDLSATENLAYYARLYGVDDTGRGAELLETMRLSDVASRPIRTYSRGMLQRLALARVLLHDPELVLLDEPFTGLDPESADALERIIADRTHHDATVVLSTHDFERGLRVADRAVLIDRGRATWASEPGATPDAKSMAEIYANRAGAA